MYTLEQINNVKKHHKLKELDRQTLDIIHNIAKEVCAPEYSKTPHFNKKKRSNMLDEEFSQLRNFKTTTLDKKQGLDLHLENVIVYINKISKDTYSTQLEMIKKELEMVDDKKDIFEKILTIISTNTFYSDLYTNLYIDLARQYGISIDYLLTNYKKGLQNIRYNVSDEDYSAYCEINKENDGRKAQALFFINLMKKGGLDIATISQHTLDIIALFENNTNNKYVLDELVDLLSIYTTEAHTFMRKERMYKTLCEFIDKYTEIQPGDGQLTNKIIFKFMDLKDIIE